MNNLEFRVWTGVEMCYDVMVGKFGVFYVNPTNGGIDEKDSACLSTMNTKYPDTVPVMQFTGITDPNGKKIFKGDIMQHIVPFEKPVVVNYNDEKCAFELNDGDTSYMVSDNHLHVIGNIYENPELLK